MSSSERKAEIRETMLAQRRRLSLPRQREAGEKILEYLKEKINWQKINRVAMYRAFGGEVDAAPLEQWLRSQDMALFFPRTEIKTWTLQMVPMESGDAWVESTLGIEEPPMGKAPIAPGELDLVLLPGLAFDRAGRRLGRGKGCYDRWLKDYTGIRVGLAHGFQLLEEIPEEPLDEGVDFVVTPEEFWPVRRKV
jgi:5-formyltetrahydrofolate cyclo-ligase